MFFNEPEDIKFLHVVNRQQRRPSPLMQDRPTLNFDPENEKSFRIWKQKWDSWLYMVSSEEGFIDSEKIFHFLISCFSDTTMTFVFELGLNEMEARNPDMIIQGLSNLLSAGKNHHLYRYEFNSRVQLPGEGFDTWLASLRALMHFSKFESDCCSKCGETRLLQQIVCGVNKPEVRKVLLEIGPGLSLDQASRIIKKSEYLNNETFLSNAAASRFQNSFNEQPIPTEFQSGQDLSEDIVIPSGNTDNLDISSEDNDIAENNVTVDLNDTQPSTSQNMRETLMNEEIERNLLFDVKSTDKTQQSEASKNLTKTTTTEETFEENLSQTDLKASQQKQAKLIPQTEANLSAQNQPDNKSSSKKQTEPKLQAEAETESVQENPTENRSGLESHYIKASTEIQGKPSMTKAATEIQGKPAKTKASSEIHKNLEQNATKAEAIAEKMTTETEAEAEDSDIKSVINKKIVKKRKSEIKTTVEESVHIKTGTKRKAKTVQKSSQSKKKSKTAESFSEKAENVELPMMDAANENLLMNVEVKSELANYQCVSCGETFSTFYQRKLHLCGNRNLLSEFGVCIICEDRQQISFMDDFGRCGNCQGNTSTLISFLFFFFLSFSAYPSFLLLYSLFF